ncbi:hypothetical protein [uncultured Tenacibaculum sp.]|uniref:hypothetical protein n=1 Tax=uncultured Tenacibaculum sp. TaxID=174713 RepID=UPI0026108A72|nr:hypothetical protein [uncultured Tenacibaculum sp.]
MKTNILNFGKALSKEAQKSISGGQGRRNIPCFEWCALDPHTQSIIPKPLFCNCNTGGTGSGNTGGGGNNNGPIDKV